MSPGLKAAIKATKYLLPQAVGMILKRGKGIYVTSLLTLSNGIIGVCRLQVILDDKLFLFSLTFNILFVSRF